MFENSEYCEVSHILRGLHPEMWGSSMKLMVNNKELKLKGKKKRKETQNKQQKPKTKAKTLRAAGENINELQRHMQIIT